MKKLIKLALMIFVFIAVYSYGFAYDNSFKPGSFFNPYVIEKKWTGEYEIRAKYPSLDYRENWRPGGYLNPYIIKKNPFLNKWEIRPRYPFW